MSKQQIDQNYLLIDQIIIGDFNASKGLKLSLLICDQIDNVSDDSDEDRDSKYNILDDTDMIEEEEECNEEDEEDTLVGNNDDYG